MFFVAACVSTTRPAGLPTGLAYIPTRDAPGCAVTRVVDGDTISVHCGTTAGNVRLVGYDTPETYRPGCPEEKRLGEAATRALERELRKATRIRVEARGRDKYDRALASLWLDGKALADIMISKGLAVSYDGGKRINWCKRLT